MVKGCYLSVAAESDTDGIYIYRHICDSPMQVGCCEEENSKSLAQTVECHNAEQHAAFAEGAIVHMP
jgi:hypothetical protein